MRKSNRIKTLTALLAIMLTIAALFTFVNFSRPDTAQAPLPSWEQLTSSAVKKLKEGNPAEAERLGHEAMKVVLVSNPKDLSVVKTHMLMGEIYRWQQKNDQAEKSFATAVTVCEQIAGRDNIDMIIPLEGLANFYYYTLVKYDKVASLYEWILYIVKKAPEIDNHQVAIRARNLADVYTLLKQYEKAEPLYKTSLTFIEKINLTDESEKTQYLLQLAEMYQRWMKCNEAEHTAQQALTIREKIQQTSQGIDAQLDVAVCLDILGSIYLTCNKPKNAEVAYRHSVKIIEAMSGPESPDLATRLTGLGMAFQKQGKYREAETNYKMALTLIEKGIGNNASDLDPVLRKYSELLLLRGRNEEAKILLARADSLSSLNDKF